MCRKGRSAGEGWFYILYMREILEKVSMRRCKITDPPCGNSLIWYNLYHIFQIYWFVIKYYPLLWEAKYPSLLFSVSSVPPPFSVRQWPDVLTLEAPTLWSLHRQSLAGIFEDKPEFLNGTSITRSTSVKLITVQVNCLLWTYTFWLKIHLMSPFCVFLRWTQII